MLPERPPMEIASVVDSLFIRERRYAEFRGNPMGSNPTAWSCRSRTSPGHRRCLLSAVPVRTIMPLDRNRCHESCPTSDRKLRALGKAMFAGILGGVRPHGRGRNEAVSCGNLAGSACHPSRRQVRHGVRIPVDDHLHCAKFKRTTSRTVI